MSLVASCNNTLCCSHIAAGRAISRNRAAACNKDNSSAYLGGRRTPKGVGFCDIPFLPARATLDLDDTMSDKAEWSLTPPTSNLCGSPSAIMRASTLSHRHAGPDISARSMCIASVCASSTKSPSNTSTRLRAGRHPNGG